MSSSESTGRIDFISSYCDSRCERCPFTMRCSTYLTRVAIAMCDGDVREGFELALGDPQPVAGARRQVPAEWLEDLGGEMSADDHARIRKAAEEGDRRVRDSTTSKIAEAYGILAAKWLNEHKTDMPGADPILAEALETIACDAFLIGAKLHRAQYGRDEHDRGADIEVSDDPKRTDWNRSAKVALISIARSETAWRVVAPTVRGDTPTELADQLGALRVDVERAFPDAWSAIRPGFDE